MENDLTPQTNQTPQTNNGNGTFIKMLIGIFIFFVGCAAMFAIIWAFPSLFTSELTKVEKNVTVTDAGIADAVEKVYDAVVVVTVYKDNTLIGSGTGFVYLKDDKIAYILTNNHVIEKANKVNVTFTSGKVIEAEVIGSDVLSDIAVLSVPAEEALQVAEIGDAEVLRVGDTTFAVGAPLDSVYSWSVSRGIISGKDRMVEVESSSGDYVMKVLQTDAAINEGNSGGPLCNSNGQVVGITSLKLVAESVEGMGFAIPIDVALDYANKIIKGEVITQPYLGISMQNVADIYYQPQYNMQIYRMLTKYEINSGVVIISVDKDTPAQKAGLEAGDVITKINDDDVSSVGFLRYYLYNYEVGDKITITYIREGKEKTTTVTLESANKTY